MNVFSCFQSRCEVGCGPFSAGLYASSSAAGFQVQMQEFVAELQTQAERVRDELAGALRAPRTGRPAAEGLGRRASAEL